MNRKLFNYLEIAIKAANKFANNANRRPCAKLGAVGQRKDGAIVVSSNSLTAFPDRKVHAEYKVCKKMDVGGTLYVARVRFDDGELGMSLPCPNCQKMIRSRGIKKVYYSINKDQYGLWNVDDDTHRICKF